MTLAVRSLRAGAVTEACSPVTLSSGFMEERISDSPSDHSGRNVRASFAFAGMPGRKAKPGHVSTQSTISFDADPPTHVPVGPSSSECRLSQVDALDIRASHAIAARSPIRVIKRRSSQELVANVAVADVPVAVDDRTYVAESCIGSVADVRASYMRDPASVPCARQTPEETVSPAIESKRASSKTGDVAAKTADGTSCAWDLSTESDAKMRESSSVAKMRRRFENRIKRRQEKRTKMRLPEETKICRAETPTKSHALEQPLRSHNSDEDVCSTTKELDAAFDFLLKARTPPAPPSREEPRCARLESSERVNALCTFKKRQRAKRGKIKSSRMKRPSNAKLIRNALIHRCLAGAHLQRKKERALEAIDTHGGDMFMILFGRKRLNFRGLYASNVESGSAFKIFGAGPARLEVSMVAAFYKFSSGAKEFKELRVKSFTSTTDGVSLKAKCWEKGRNG